MLDRIAAEIAELRRRYPLIDVPPDTTYVVVRGLSLSPGWNRRATDVLVMVPPGYPATPPDNFFVPEGLRLADQRMPTNYSEGATMLNQNWGQFSFHSQEWRPMPDPCEGDGLVTYFVLIENRLTEVD
jgi:hypothetical protein